MPAKFEWPERGGRRLNFLAQLSLHEIGAPELGNEGHLLVFYDEEQPWGHASDWDGWRVVHLRNEPLVRAPRGSGARAITVERAWSLPSHSELTDRGVDAPHEYDALRRDILGAEGGHRLLGHPDEVQGALGSPSRQLYETKDRPGINPFTKQPIVIRGRSLKGVPEEVKKLIRAKVEWRLLLQLDTDEELDWCWGDAGRLYFRIRADDLAVRRFDRTWLELQCG